MNSIKIKCQKPYGAIVAEGARKYAGYALDGAQKALIVSDETVFRLYGNGLKKIIKNAGAEAYTFIFPSGENGKNKHVLDKLLILMTELDLKSTDCLVAFGGCSVASLVGFAGKIFKGGVPYVYMPTTLSGMLDLCVSGKVGVDFIGKTDLLRETNYPLAVFADTEYLKTLPAVHMQNGLAEIIRLGMIGDGEMVELMENGEPSIDELIYRAVMVKLKLGKKSLLAGKNFAEGKGRFALNFSAVAEKIVGLKVPYGKLVAYGMVIASETAMALGIASGLDERMIALLAKYDIKWDIGIVTTKLWQTFLEKNKTKNKITIVLPTKVGKVAIRKINGDKIKEIF